MERKRFTERTHPIAAQYLKGERLKYELLKGGDTEHYNIPAVAKVLQPLMKLVKEIDIVSAPFVQAAYKAVPKLFSPDIMSQLPDFNLMGAMIVGKGFYPYVIVKKKDMVYSTSIFFEGTFCKWYISTVIDINADTVQDVFCSHKDINPEHGESADIATTIALFKHFADTQTHILPVTKKTELYRCIYKNDLPANVNLLTCRWFTDLHKSNPFLVRGHFRCQPCGTDNMDRKLVWIDQYLKDGYTSEAVKDKVQ